MKKMLSTKISKQTIGGEERFIQYSKPQPLKKSITAAKDITFV
jgi:hypothetical protein